MANSLVNRTGTLLAPQLDYILIDGSGSMMDKWYDTLAALDGFMDALRGMNIASHGIVHVFDSRELKTIERSSVIGDWPLFSREPIRCPGGMTPLYDAINLMGRELRELNPPRASIVIITDGDENGSRHTSAAQARAILDWCRAKGWQVTFLGADFNNSKQAKLLGADEANSVGVQKALLKDAGKALGAKRVRNALFGEDMNFSDEERKNFGGYLTNGGSNG